LLPLPSPVQKPQEGGLLLAPARCKEAAFREEIRECAAAVILVPNHRSGDTSPSREDIAITNKRENTGETVAVRVLDHVMVGDGAYANMLEKRY
jgi:DNA repair protein RadC